MPVPVEGGELLYGQLMQIILLLSQEEVEEELYLDSLKVVVNIIVVTEEVMSMAVNFRTKV